MVNQSSIRSLAAGAILPSIFARCETAQARRYFFVQIVTNLKKILSTQRTARNHRCWRKFKKHSLRRFVALGLVTTLVSEQALWAESNLPVRVFSSPTSPVIRTEEKFKLNFSGIKPWGTVTTFHLETAKAPLVIHIEDAHLQKDAQQSIARIIERISTQTKIQAVGIEGAPAELSHETLSTYPDTFARKVLANHWVSQGVISGPEYAAIALKPSIRLIGLEDAKLYGINKNAFLRVQRAGKHAKTLFEQAEKKIQSLENLIYSKKYKNFSKFRRELKKSHNFLEYASRLLPLLQLNRDQSDYLQLKNAARLHALVISQRGRKKASPGAAKTSELRALESALGLDLFEEIARAEEVLRAEEVKRPLSAELDHASRVFEITRALLDLSLSKRDADFFLKHRKDFNAGIFQEKINRLFKLKNFDFSLEVSKTDWNQSIETAEKFYLAALSRDRVLAENAVKKIRKEFPRGMFLVAGGFHTPGIQAYLKENKISFLTIRPRIRLLQSDFEFHKKYKSEMAGRPSPEESFILSPELFRKQNALKDSVFQLQTPRHLPLKGLQPSPQSLAFQIASFQILAGLSAFSRGEKPAQRLSEWKQAMPDSVRKFAPLAQAALTQASFYYLEKNKKARAKNGIVIFSQRAGSRPIFYWGAEASRLGVPRSKVAKIPGPGNITFYYGITNELSSKRLQSMLALGNRKKNIRTSEVLQADKPARVMLQSPRILKLRSEVRAVPYKQSWKHTLQVLSILFFLFQGQAVHAFQAGVPSEGRPFISRIFHKEDLKNHSTSKDLERELGMLVRELKKEIRRAGVPWGKRGDVFKALLERPEGSADPVTYKIVRSSGGGRAQSVLIPVKVNDAMKDLLSQIQNLEGGAVPAKEIGKVSEPSSDSAGDTRKMKLQDLLVKKAKVPAGEAQQVVQDLLGGSSKMKFTFTGKSATAGVPPMKRQVSRSPSREIKELVAQIRADGNRFVKSLPASNPPVQSGDELSPAKAAAGSQKDSPAVAIVKSLEGGINPGDRSKGSVDPKQHQGAPSLLIDPTPQPEVESASDHLMRHSSSQAPVLTEPRFTPEKELAREKPLLEQAIADQPFRKIKEQPQISQNSTNLITLGQWINKVISGIPMKIPSLDISWAYLLSFFSALGLAGFIKKFQGVKGLTAKASIEKDLVKMKQNIQSPQAIRMGDRLLAEEEELRKMNEQEHPSQSSFTAVLVTFVLESLSILLPVYFYGVFHFSFSASLLFFLTIRAGMMAAAYLNEAGHLTSALVAGHDWNVFNAGNLTGNRTWAWIFKFLPFSFLIHNPYVFIPETPSSRQSEFIRWSGWWVGVLPVLAAAGLWIFDLHPVFQGLGSGMFVVGMILGTALAVGTDWMDKNVNPRFYACGIMGYFRPSRESFSETMTSLFETIRTVSVRGGQAGGFVTSHDIRSRGALGLVLAGIYGAGFVALTGIAHKVSLSLGVLAFTFTPASIGFLLVLGAFASLITIFIILPGQVAQRTRTTNAKRADLSLTMLSNLAVKLAVTFLIFGQMAWTFVLAHARFSTSSPDPRATQPHTWVPTSVWNLLFHRKKIWQRVDGQYESKVVWAETTVGHNGDQNAYYFRALRKWISHNLGNLHPFLNLILQYENKDLGDTVNISGLMKLFTAEGNFEAAVRRAYLEAVMDEPHEVLSLKSLKALAQKFDAVLSKHRETYETESSGQPDHDKNFMNKVPDSVIEQMTQDFLDEYAGDQEFSQIVSPEKQRGFVRKAFTLFHTASPFEAMQQFAVKLDPADPDFLGGTDGTFGLFSYSPAYREFNVYAKGQPVSVSFDANYKKIWLASERSALQNGKARYRIELKDDEILRVQWGKNGRMKFTVYHVLRKAYVPKAEIEERMRDILSDSLVGKRPDPYEMFPLEAGVAQIADRVQYAADSVKNPQDPNFNVVNLLKQALEKLHKQALKGTSASGTQVLIYGSESNQSFAILLKNLFKKLYPNVRVDIKLPDEIAQVAVKYLKHPRQAMKELQITKDTLIIPISNSGRSFDVENVTKYLSTLVPHGVAFLGDRDNQMSDWMGPGRILSTEVGGLQTSEARTHVNEAMHTLIFASMLRAAQDLNKKYPKGFLGGDLGDEHLKILEQDLDLRIKRIRALSGTDKEHFAMFRYLKAVGKRMAGFSNEVTIVNFVTLMFYALSFTFGWIVVPSAIMEAFDFSPSQIFGNFLGTLSEILLNYTFLYFFGRMIVRGLWRVRGLAGDWVRKRMGYPPLFSRPLMKRPTSPAIFLGEADYRFQAAGQMLRKTLALGWENSPQPQQSEMGQINHAFAPTRGDVLLGVIRRNHPAQTGADTMAARQFGGNRSFGEGVFKIMIGHAIGSLSADVADVKVDLELPSMPSMDYGQFGFEEEHEWIVRDLAEMLDGLERAVAEDVILTAHARTLALPWYTSIFIEPLLMIPALKWVVYLTMIRYPWLFRFYPYWATQGRTVMHTTATPTDMSPVQMNLSEQIEKAGREKTVKMKKVMLSGAGDKHAPAVKIVGDVYEDSREIPTAPYVYHPQPAQVAAEPKHKSNKSKEIPSEKPLPIRQEIQDAYMDALTESLDRDLERASRNGGAPHFVDNTMMNLRSRNFDPRKIEAFAGIAREKLKAMNEPRSELRRAIASKEDFQNRILLENEKERILGVISRLRESGVEVEDPGTYFSDAHRDALDIKDATAASEGVFVLTDFYQETLIRKIAAKLPEHTHLILYLNPKNTIREERLRLIRSLADEIAAHRIVIARSNLDLVEIIRDEMEKRNISEDELIEFASETPIDFENPEDRLAVEAMMIQAAKLTENRLVVMSEQSRLPNSMGRHFTFSDTFQTLYESTRHTQASA